MEETEALTFRERLANDAVRFRVSAVLLLFVMAGVASLTVAMYKQSFTDKALVTLHGDRAGLQMRAGTIVKLRGVDVGRTGKSTVNDDGTVDVQLELKPDMLASIPPNVSVSLQQLTAFGNKHVALGLPAKPEAGHVRAGDVIDIDSTSVEVNTLFEHLDEVLTTLQPAKVNAVLGAISGALNGQGESLGETIETLNSYLGKINEDLPTLATDFDKGTTVLNVYADAAPDLMRVLDNGSFTARSLVSEKDQFREFLAALEAVSNRGTSFLARNGEPLIDLLRSSVPTTSLLARYSPEYACFLQGMDKANRIVSTQFGTAFPGTTANLTVMASKNTSYAIPGNLPVMGMDSGPQCHGMPGYNGGTYPASFLKPYDAGGTAATPVPDGDAPVTSDPAGGNSLAKLLFGPLVSGGTKP